MVIGGRKLDLHQVAVPVYSLATREDHIAPAKSCFTGPSCLAARCATFFPARPHRRRRQPTGEGKYQYWSARGEGEFADCWPGGGTQRLLVARLAGLVDRPGARQGCRTRAGEGKLAAICDAPGTYVRMNRSPSLRAKRSKERGRRGPLSPLFAGRVRGRVTGRTGPDKRARCG